MKAVVDTNVVAYFLLGTTGFADRARACLVSAAELMAPAHWEAELANVVWMAVRSGVLPREDAPLRLSLARRLGVDSVPVSSYTQAAVLRSLQSGVALYDTLFVELAVRARCQLFTFDKAILEAFPDIAVRPGGGPATP